MSFMKRRGIVKGKGDLKEGVTQEPGGKKCGDR